MRQMSFLPAPIKEYGGDTRKGKRKIRRPFDPKRALHVTLKSSKARGMWSMLQKERRLQVQELLHDTADKYDIRLFRYANVGNHIHLLIQAKKREHLRAFLREFAGKLAAMIT